MRKNNYKKLMYISFSICIAILFSTVSMKAYDGDYKPYQQGQQYQENEKVENTTNDMNTNQYSSMAMYGGLTSSISNRNSRGTEIEIGRSNTASWNGGNFYEYMTKEYLSENDKNDTVNYRIRYHIKHWGSNASYTYQNGAVELWINGNRIATYSSYINVHITNKDVIAGYTDVTLKKNVNNRIEFRDANISGSMTSINVAGNIFHALPIYTVTFINDGQVIKTQNVTKYQNATAPIISKVGYTLEWSDKYTNITSNKTIIAKWNANTYQIEYDANGGINAPPTQSFKFNSNEKISSQVPTRKGYTFKGWISDPNNKMFSPNDTIPYDWGSFKLIAQWDINKYTIVFDTNGGSRIDNQIVNYGGKVTKPKNPVKDGLIFEDWYIDKTLKVKYDFNNIVSNNMVLYAKWIPYPQITTKYDRYFLVQEKFDIEDIKSKIKAVDEYNNDISSRIVLTGFENVEVGIVGDYVVGANVKTDLGYEANAMITIHISDDMPMQQIRPINQNALNTLSFNSKWWNNINILKTILEKDNVIDTITVKNE